MPARSMDASRTCVSDTWDPNERNGRTGHATVEHGLIPSALASFRGESSSPSAPSWAGFRVRRRRLLLVFVSVEVVHSDQVGEAWAGCSQTV